MSDRDSVPKTAKMNVAVPGDTLESAEPYRPDNVTRPIPLVSVVSPVHGSGAVAVTTPSAGVTPLGGRVPPVLVALEGVVLEHTPPQRIRVRYPVRDLWKDGHGAAQAGIVVAMMEAVAGMCAFAQDPLRQSSPLELSTHFFRSVRAASLTVDGAVLRAGKSTITIEVVAWDDASEMCAKMAVTSLYG